MVSTFSNARDPLLVGGGASGEAFRAVDWTQGPLGPLERWPESLKVSLRNLFSSRHPMLVWWGPELITFYNDAYRPSLGPARHPRAMGMRGRECWPGVWPTIGPEIEGVLERGESTCNEDRLVPIFRNGRMEEVYWTCGCSPIFGDDGRVSGVLAIAAETNRAVGSQQEVIGILEAMSDAFFSVDANWTLTRVNAQMEVAARMKRKDLLGKNFLELFLADPALRDSNYWRSYHRAMSERVAVHFEDYYPPLDLWTLVSAYPSPEGGLAVFFRDITQNKRIALETEEAKQKLTAIFQGSASALAFFRGRELIYEITNSRYEDLVPKRQLLGRPLLEALPELEGSPFPSLMQEVFDTGTPKLTYEEVAPLTNPVTGAVEQRYFDTAISRIADPAGKPYGVFVHVTETTERVVARKKLEDALAARDTFLSIASHELRTPITGMKLQAELMKRAIARQDPAALTAGRVGKLVAQTDEGLSRMSRLIEDMLDISRIQSGRLDLLLEPIDLCAVVRGVLDRFAEQLAGAGITISLDQRVPELPFPADRFRLEQVMTNLVTNAIRYAPGAPLRVELDSKDGALATVAFQDGGPGIAEKDRERVFERFARLVSANQISGLGLGLYIVRQIIAVHGGTIHLEGSPHPGARFVIELPMRRA